jgi:hypothetical protein
MEITLSTLQKLVGKKAPIVGIPRPDGQPFAVERATLARLIQGLESCEIKLNAHLEIKGPSRHYKLNSLDMQRQAAFSAPGAAGCVRRKRLQSSRVRSGGRPNC